MLDINLFGLTVNVHTCFRLTGKAYVGKLIKFMSRICKMLMCLFSSSPSALPVPPTLTPPPAPKSLQHCNDDVHNCQSDMNILGAWKRGYTGKDVVVTILDDGIERNHPDLFQNYVSVQQQYVCVNVESIRFSFFVDEGGFSMYSFQRGTPSNLLVCSYAEHMFVCLLTYYGQIFHGRRLQEKPLINCTDKMFHTLCDSACAAVIGYS